MRISDWSSDVCSSDLLPFTTSYHTRFPEYLSARVPVPLAWGYAFMRWFHRPSRGVMLATQSMKRELGARGSENLVDWTPGADTALLRPHEPQATAQLGTPAPIHLYFDPHAAEHTDQKRKMERKRRCV